MTLETRHIVQPYRSVRRRLVPAEALSVRSAPVVKERALRFFETGRYAYAGGCLLGDERP